MALRMLVGKPGGGKSYRALVEVIDELLYGDRVVITNLSLRLGEINALLAERAPGKDIDIFARIRVLTEQETKRFWLYRGPNVEVPDVTKDDERRGVFPDFAPYAGSGCLYVIDEAHIHFDARSWADAGQSLTFYNSQHRKLNDELIFVTQFLDLIDKRVKGFAQEYWFSRNNGLERIFTVFQLPSYFTLSVYQKPPTGVLDCPSERHRYTLDLQVAACYDTSAGVGISGRKRPERRPKKGLPVYFIAVPVFGVLGLLYWAPNLAAKAAVAGASGADKAITQPVRAASSRAPDDPPSVAAVPPSAPPSVVLGYVVHGRAVVVFLADGSILTESSPQLNAVDTRGGRVRIAGEWHAIPPPRVRPVEPPHAQLVSLAPKL